MRTLSAALTFIIASHASSSQLQKFCLRSQDFPKTFSLSYSLPINSATAKRVHMVQNFQQLRATGLIGGYSTAFTRKDAHASRPGPGINTVADVVMRFGSAAEASALTKRTRIQINSTLKHGGQWKVLPNMGVGDGTLVLVTAYPKTITTSFTEILFNQSKYASAIVVGGAARTFTPSQALAFAQIVDDRIKGKSR